MVAQCYMLDDITIVWVSGFHCVLSCVVRLCALAGQPVITLPASRDIIRERFWRFLKY